MEPFGTLTVYAYTSNARLPVEGAMVTVKNESTVLAEARTDRSGYITPVRISAPNASQSQSPNQLSPFYTVDVTITHPDYETEKAKGVQVFPNVITVQAFRMLPLSPQYPGSELDIDTPPQNL